MNILFLLLNNKTITAIIVLLLIIVGQFGYIYSCKARIAVSIAEKAVLEEKLKTSQTNVKTLESSVAEQNAAIEKLKSDAQAREESHAGEIKKAKQNAEAYRKKAEELMKRYPQPKQSVCDAANTLINEQIKNGK